MNKIILFFYRFTEILKNFIEKYKHIDFSFSKKHIVILLGDKNFDISVFHKGELSDYILIDEGSSAVNKAIKFLSKFRRYKLFFVLDRSDTEIHHSDIPVSQGIVYKNPLTKFIETKFDEDILVSSNVYKITRSDQEIYHSIFASTRAHETLDKLLDYTSFNGFDINGIYFFALNVPLMIENMLKHLSLDEDYNPLYIFITVTSVNKIRVLIISGNDVMHSEIIDYPQEKGEAYVQGTIEQVVIDSLISLKNHIHHNKVEPLLFIIANESLKNLLLKSKFNIQRTVIISDREFHLNSSKRVVVNKLPNHIISYFLNQKTHYHASNTIVSEYLRLKSFNKFLSLPWYILISIFVFILVGIEINNILEENKSNNINAKFYSLSQNYRTLRKEYPDITDLEDVVSFYYAEEELKTSQKLPFDTFKVLLSAISNNFDIKRLYWEDYNKKSYIIAKVTYQTSQFNDVPGAINQLNKAIEALKMKMPDKDVSFEYEENEILNSNNVVTIELELRISW